MSTESRNPFDWKAKLNAHAEEASDLLRDYVHGNADEAEVLRSVSQLAMVCSDVTWQLNRNIMEKFERAKGE